MLGVEKQPAVEEKKDTLSDFDEQVFFQDGKMFIRRSEDVETLLEDNAYARNHCNNGYGKSRVWRRIGSIPCIVVEKILREHGVNILDGSPEADRYVRRFLQQNNKFMTVNKI